jgi:hypothetical protein
MCRVAREFRWAGACGSRVLALGIAGSLLALTPRAVAQVAASRTSTATRTVTEAKAAQLQVAAKHPEQLRVESINPTQRAPAVSINSSGATIAVKAGEQLVVHKAAEAPEPPNAKVAEQVKAPLPSTLIVGVSDATKGTVIRQFQPFMTMEVSPLRWDSHVMSYVTTVVVGLDPFAGEDQSGPVALPATIRFQLSGENVDKIEPPEVQVAEAGTRGYQRFKVLTKKFDRAVKVIAHSTFGDRSNEANVEPGPTFFELGQSDASVDGFGLGKTTISVRQRAANGELLPTPAQLRVHLRTSGGFLTPSYVELPAHGATAETSLVSSTWGQAIVREANADEASHRTVTVEFTFPWLKFILGFIGAGCAGALRVFSTKRGKRQSWLPVFVGCLASGITVDILIALGAPLAPDWLLNAIRSELAWFAIGLIAGYPGIAVVAWAGEKLFAFQKPEPANKPT